MNLESSNQDERIEARVIPFLDNEREVIQLAAIEALARIGTVESVSELSLMTEGLFRDSDLRDAARAAIEMILSRTGAEAGSLSLAEDSAEDGHLSVAPETGAQLSLEEE